MSAREAYSIHVARDVAINRAIDEARANHDIHALRAALEERRVNRTLRTLTLSSLLLSGINPGE